MANLDTTPKGAEAPKVQGEGTTVPLPNIPEHITWKFINDYLKACDPSKKAAFDSMINRRGYKWAVDEAQKNLTSIAPSAIVDIFMEAI